MIRRPRIDSLLLVLGFSTIAPSGVSSVRAQPLAWSQRSAVPGASDPAMAYDTDRRVCVAFAGYDQRSWTLEWNGSTWAQRATTGRYWNTLKSPRP